MALKSVTQSASATVSTGLGSAARQSAYQPILLREDPAEIVEVVPIAVQAVEADPAPEVLAEKTGYPERPRHAPGGSFLPADRISARAFAAASGDYDRFLPDIVRGYRALGVAPDRVELVARRELRWWVVRRELGESAGRAAGDAITALDAALYGLPEAAKLRQVRAGYAERYGDLARFASSFCEGGGASLYYEGMQAGGSELNDRIAAACKGVYDDEVGHATHGASELTAQARTEVEWALAREMVEGISKQRVRMRNEQFGNPLSDARLSEIFDGKIEVPDRFAALLV